MNDRLKKELQNYKQNVKTFKPYHISMKDMSLWLDSKKGK